GKVKFGPRKGSHRLLLCAPTRHSTVTNSPGVTAAFHEMIPMFFRIWFYVCKFGVLLFGLCFGSFVFEIYCPEAKVARKVILMTLVPICIAGAGLGLAIFVFGMRLRCPYCNGKQTSIGGSGNVVFLECSQCGVVSGNVIRDFKLRVEPPEEG